ncbi:basic amino acid/polyamine antiporter, APA family [Actinokineospora alba]|uniref:Basic amino acid/polyamine antiporter, APA family n=2 Tax=Actinokineospora alba TaxID=504798 RepID=A0A1H0JRJ5_9PSEU|nr:APA family basic amino acid/polyamine antiporter [Actinokineospora alba]SDH94125.1 basic amino acid/polyamine antiporter, APA family [Actinokineospora alba]SDO46122.1 basic amino acid/polyamine antiporter, APA family [Actinokineospora alba]
MGQQVARAVGTPLGTVAGMLGAGALVVVSPAVGAAGWWSVAGLALAVLVASLTAVSVADLTAASADQSGYLHVRDRLGVWPSRLAGVLGLTGRVVAMAAVANMITAYVAPTGSAGTIGVFTVCVIYAGHANGFWRLAPIWRAAAVVLIVTIGLLVAVGLSIHPAEHHAITQPGVAGSNEATGILTAAGVFFFAFIGLDRQQAGRARTRVVSIMAAAVGLLLVLLVALRQLGGPRLALSPAPLRDTLAAADASSLGVLLAIGLLAGGILALYALVEGAMEFARDMRATGDLPAGGLLGPLVVVSAGAAAVAEFVPTGHIVALAACLVLVSYAFVNSAARSLCRAQRSTWIRTGCCGLALSVIVAVNISVVSLLSAVAVVLVGTLLCTLSARKADRA